MSSKRIIFILATIITLSLHAQTKINYKKTRDSTMVMGCGNVDSATIVKSYHNLIHLDTNLITQGKHDYFYDLGMTCWMLGYGMNISLYKSICVNSFKRCIQLNKKSGLAYHNLCLVYEIEKDTFTCKYYLQLYKKVTSKKYLNKPFIEQVEKFLGEAGRQ